LHVEVPTNAFIHRHGQFDQFFDVSSLRSTSSILSHEVALEQYVALLAVGPLWPGSFSGHRDIGSLLVAMVDHG
jgi:hypothetical protein